MLLQRKSGGFQESGSIFRRSGSILKKQKVSEEVESFLRCFVHAQVSENGAASLMDLAELRLTLPELHLGLPEFSVWHSNRNSSANACYF